MLPWVKNSGFLSNLIDLKVFVLFANMKSMQKQFFAMVITDHVLNRRTFHSMGKSRSAYTIKISKKIESLLYVFLMLWFFAFWRDFVWFLSTIRLYNGVLVDDFLIGSRSIPNFLRLLGAADLFPFQNLKIWVIDKKWQNFSVAIFSCH